MRGGTHVLAAAVLRYKWWWLRYSYDGPMDDPYDTLTSRIEHIALNLTLVSIPRSSFLDHIHAVVSQLLKPNAEFFSITLNDTEVLLILNEDARREFQPKQTTDELLTSDAQNDADINFEFDPSSGGVQVSRVQWSALSLDVSRSPARLRKISDCMQSSSIPVIYQSAMNCDYLFVPTAHLQRALLALSENVGLVLSEDESYRRQRHSTSRGWEKPQLRKSKRRTRHTNGCDDYAGSQSSSPSSSDISSSDHRGRSKLPSQAIQKAYAPQDLPPVRLLPHKMVFHGLNSGPHGDWLLKLVRMIGWPDSLLVPKAPKVFPPDQFGYGNRYPSSRLFQQGPLASNTERPRRPGFVTRHSDDAHSFKKGQWPRPSDLELNPHARQSLDFVKPGMTGQVQTHPRSRSTSYPDVLPDFHQQHGATNRLPLSSQSSVIEGSLGAAGFTLGLSPQAEHPPPASQDQEAALKEEQPPAPSQNQRHTQALPFFSLTYHTRSSGDTEVSIMTRGSLLAQLFESSMLIGGSGDIAVSDSEEEGLCEEEYARGARGTLIKGLNGSPGVHKKTSSIDEAARFVMPPSTPGVQSSISYQSANSGLDDGFKCLQVDLSGIDSKDHARMLSFLAESLDSHSIKHHFTRTLGAINVMIPHSQTKRACDILRAVPGR